MSDDNPPVDHVPGDEEAVTTPIEEHVKSRSTWLRLVFMIVFYVLASVATLVLSAVVVLGFLWVLFTGEPNRQLQSVGRSMGQYVHQIIDYMTYNSDERPFPFEKEWPEADSD
jgi:hypothetical protein